MKFEDAVKIVYPDKFDSWWKGVDKDKDYQKKVDKLLDEDKSYEGMNEKLKNDYLSKLTNEPDPSRMMDYLSKVRR